MDRVTYDFRCYGQALFDLISINCLALGYITITYLLYFSWSLISIPLVVCTWVFRLQLFLIMKLQYENCTY